MISYSGRECGSCHTTPHCRKTGIRGYCALPAPRSPNGKCIFNDEKKNPDTVSAKERRDHLGQTRCSVNRLGVKLRGTRSVPPVEPIKLRADGVSPPETRGMSDLIHLIIFQLHLIRVSSLITNTAFSQLISDTSSRFANRRIKSNRPVDEWVLTVIDNISVIPSHQATD